MKGLASILVAVLAVITASNLQSQFRDKRILLGPQGGARRLSALQPVGQRNNGEPTHSSSPGNVEVPQGQKNPAETEIIWVYDARGQYLGILVDFWESPGGPLELFDALFLPNLGEVIRIDLETGHIEARRVLFKTKDCTGRPYLQAKGRTNLVFRAAGSCPPGRYFKGSSPPERVTIGSSLSCTTDGQEACRSQDSVELQAVEAVEIPSEDIPFAEPVALPLRYE